MVTIQKEVRKRGFFGKLVKWTFILFNILMAIWLFSYFSSIGDLAGSAGSDAEAAGVAIGGTIGTGMLLFVWVCGSVILGLLTLLSRGQRIFITEEQ